MAHYLSCCRSLISRLEDTDPRKMTHEEKLAFWINIHNSLVMHVITLETEKDIHVETLHSLSYLVLIVCIVLKLFILQIGIFSIWDPTK